jgi:hypothetical protein
MARCLEERLRAVQSANGAAVAGVSAGSTARLFAALTCGEDHVAAEGLRLLVRLWAPAAARIGRGPWQMGRGDAALLEEEPQVIIPHLVACPGLSVRPSVHPSVFVCPSVCPSVLVHVPLHAGHRHAGRSPCLALLASMSHCVAGGRA